MIWVCAYYVSYFLHHFWNLHLLHDFFCITISKFPHPQYIFLIIYLPPLGRAFLNPLTSHPSNKYHFKSWNDFPCSGSIEDWLAPFKEIGLWKRHFMQQNVQTELHFVRKTLICKIFCCSNSLASSFPLVSCEWGKIRCEGWKTAWPIQCPSTISYTGLYAPVQISL